MKRRGQRSKKNEEDVDSYRHEAETRKNAVPIGLASYHTPHIKPKKYDCNPHLDPQLIWAGKKEHTSFEGPILSLHIRERIDTEAIIRSIKREDRQMDLFAKPEMQMKVAH